MKISLIANDSTYTYNLRKEIIEELLARGNQVEIIGEKLLFCEELEEMGCTMTEVQTGRHGTNPYTDLKLLKKYICILRQSRPDVVLTYNIKPNSYGGFACRLLKIPYFPNITGLGTAIEHPGKLQKIAIFLYKTGIRKAECVFFQNSENEQFFRVHRMLGKRSRTRLLPGSGVNLQQHPLLDFPDGDKIHFLFVSRVLEEKGIDLYLAAAVKYHSENIMFHICGMCDDPQYLEILGLAQERGDVVYHGQQKDMQPFLEMCDCLVHPSWYPEGMSNVLQEAAASGRPIIATDRSGCREIVDDGVTGYVVPVQNQEALFKAVEKILAMSAEERRKMGLAGRTKMEREFDRKIVVKAYMKEMEKLGEVDG